VSDVSRITQQSSTMLMVADLETSLGTLTQLQQQAASGKSINQPSDNPGGTSQVLTLNAQLGRFNQYASNISDGQSWLNTASSTLGSVIKTLDQVQSDVLQGANASSNDPSSNQALAQQVTTLKQELVSLSATTYNGRYIFSGTYGTAPYPNAPSGNYGYAGSTNPVTRQISPGQSQAISITGDQVFGTGTSSMFTLLDNISQDLANGNTSNLSGSDLTELKDYINTATQAQGNAGALGAALTSSSTQVSDTVTSLQDQVANIQDANEAQVASELDLAETSYQAALETTAKIIQPSLVQFLS
jgi:flagellar hook-associated protein 3 FlgL